MYMESLVYIRFHMVLLVLICHRRDFSVTNISAINRDGNRSPIREKNLFASERKFEQSLQKSNESLKTLLLPKYQDSVLSYSEKQVDELDGKVQKLNVQLNEIVYQK